MFSIIIDNTMKQLVNCLILKHKLQTMSVVSSKKSILRLISLRFYCTEKQRKVIEYMSVLDSPESVPLFCAETQSSEANEHVPASTKFVPACSPAEQEDIEKLQEFTRKSRKLFVMTGLYQGHSL